MAKIVIMGQEFYMRMLPTFPGSKAGILCKMPYTARNPTVPQLKARLWLAQKAVGLTNTYGSVPDAGRGKGGPTIAREIAKLAPGVGTHGGKTARAYTIAKRKGEAGVQRIRDQLRAKTGVAVEA